MFWTQKHLDPEAISNAFAPGGRLEAQFDQFVALVYQVNRAFEKYCGNLL